jgi:hypothetical protein
VNVKTKTLTDVESNPLPLLEYDSARIAIIEPSRMIKPIDIAEHCVFCFFQEVIRELVSGGPTARQLEGRQGSGYFVDPAMVSRFLIQRT